MSRVHSGAELSRELKKIGSLATEKEMSVIMKKLSVDAFRDLVTYSARDTGYLRSNWDVTTAKAPNNKMSSDGGGYSDAKWPGTRIEAGDAVTLYNNTEYAMYLELGTPTMRAQPMVRPTYYRALSTAKRLSYTLSKEKVN